MMVLGAKAQPGSRRASQPLSNVSYAKTLLGEAEARIVSSTAQIKRKMYAYVVRQSQEAVELSLKAALRLAGIDFPKQHDVSDVLTASSDKYPRWFVDAIPEMVRVSRELVQKRIPSMYGEELSGKGPGELFDRDDASSSLSDANRVFKLVSKLVIGWS